MKKLIIRGLTLGALAVALSGCYYYAPPPAYPAYYGYDSGYYGYPAYYGGYYGPSVSLGYWGGGHHGWWHH